MYNSPFSPFSHGGSLLVALVRLFARLFSGAFSDIFSLILSMLSKKLPSTIKGISTNAIAFYAMPVVDIILAEQSTTCEKSDIIRFFSMFYNLLFRLCRNTSCARFFPLQLSCSGKN